MKNKKLLSMLSVLLLLSGYAANGMSNNDTKSIEQKIKDTQQKLDIIDKKHYDLAYHNGTWIGISALMPELFEEREKTLQKLIMLKKKKEQADKLTEGS